jgi:hypothetical protein
MKDHICLTIRLLVNKPEVYDLCTECIKRTRNVEVFPFQMFYLRNYKNEI